MEAKLAAAISQLIQDNRDLTARLERLEKVKPAVVNGRDGKDGVSPSVEDIVQAVVAQLPEPEKVDTKAIVDDVVAQIPKPRDGRDAPTVNVSDVAAIVLAKIEKPKDGKPGKDGRNGPDLETVVSRVKAQVQNGEQGEPGPPGPPGKPGKDGVSVTDVQLNNNDLFVFLDGKKRKAGTVKVPTPTAPFQPGGGSARGGAAEPLPVDILRGGWADYINGDLTPITIPAGVETKLTLDASSGAIIDEYLPQGVTSVWDSVNSQFDFSELSLGDMVDIRVDGSLTNTGLNNSFVLNLVAAIGSASEFTLPFASGSRFIAGTSVVSRYNGVFMGSQDVIDNPAELRFLSSNNASGFLIDIYIKVLKIGAG